MFEEDRYKTELLTPAGDREECVSVRYAPNGLIRLLLLQVESLLVIHCGREQPDISHDDFIVRAEYSQYKTVIDSSFSPEQRRAFIRSHIPLCVSIQFRGARVYVAWCHIYPALAILRDSDEPLVDLMAQKVVMYFSRQLNHGLPTS